MIVAEPALERLRCMPQRVLDQQAGHSGELHELKARLGSLEQAVADLRDDIRSRAGIRANLQDQLDRVSARMDRVERRMDIAD